MALSSPPLSAHLLSRREVSAVTPHTRPGGPSSLFWEGGREGGILREGGDEFLSGSTAQGRGPSYVYSPNTITFTT